MLASPNTTYLLLLRAVCCDTRIPRKFYIGFGNPHVLYNRTHMLLVPFDPFDCLSYLIKSVGESSKPGRCSRASKTGS